VGSGGESEGRRLNMGKKGCRDGDKWKEEK
jgi:hypothetical protein